MQAIYDLRTLCYMHQLDPGQYKITIEAKTPKAFHDAEMVIRSNCLANPYTLPSPEMIDGLFRGKPFEIMGLPIEFKAPPVVSFRPYRPYCDCSDCRRSQS